MLNPQGKLIKVCGAFVSLSGCAPRSQALRPHKPLFTDSPARKAPRLGTLRSKDSTCFSTARLKQAEQTSTERSTSVRRRANKHGFPASAEWPSGSSLKSVT